MASKTRLDKEDPDQRAEYPRHVLIEEVAKSSETALKRERLRLHSATLCNIVAPYKGTFTRMSERERQCDWWFRFKTSPSQACVALASNGN